MLVFLWMKKWVNEDLGVESELGFYFNGERGGFGGRESKLNGWFDGEKIF